jgi:prepilin-type N-terminal cleavage/methylation domain-containing protein
MVRSQGFTLIELLIVVAILGILTALVGNNYLEALNRANQSACRQNLKTVFTALQSYRLDYGKFPPADGIADTQPHPAETAYGCGPAANGYWSGVSWLLVKYDYCSAGSLFCPTLKQKYNRLVAAYPTCRSSALEGKEVPQWHFLRYAYNGAAADAGGSIGGEQNVEKDWSRRVWLARCLHLDIAQFDPERAVPFPLRLHPQEDGAEGFLPGEHELTVLGDVRERVLHPDGG